MEKLIQEVQLNGLIKLTSTGIGVKLKASDKPIYSEVIVPSQKVRFFEAI